MVRTGARAAALLQMLQAGGLRPDVSRSKPPRIHHFDPGQQELLERTYRNLAGASLHTPLRPGAWDLSVNGVLVELDEELHFNRYRAATLAHDAFTSLPWATSWARYCIDHEPECLRAATWGRRWTNESSARMFGAGAPPGNLEDEGGAPRWKQRAVYDAMKDVAALGSGVRLARLSVHDEVGGVALGSALAGKISIDPHALIELLDARTT